MGVTAGEEENKRCIEGNAPYSTSSITMSYLRWSGNELNERFRNEGVASFLLALMQHAGPEKMVE